MRDSHPAWAASTAYAQYKTVVPLAVENGYHYICTTAGTSGGTEPTWSTTVGNTTNDGTAVWTNNGKRGDVLCKLVLTSGGTTKTYGVDTANRLLRVSHSEQPYSQTARVLVENSDNVLTVLSLEGYTGVLSYGFATSAGDEYSPTAPLVVKAQELLSTGGKLVCQFDLIGLPDQLDSDKALVSYSPLSDDPDECWTIVAAIAGATMSCYSHCTPIVTQFDSYDTLITSFKPKDSFRIRVGQSRLSAIRELLGWTKCVMRFESDGKLHISSPTVTGSTYDYEYNDTIPVASTYHTFFSKIYRRRLVLPNRYIVKNADDTEDVDVYYTGEATSAASYALLPKTEPVILRLASDAEAVLIATALIQRAELDQERGSGFAPMNVGQEVHDYVNITDTRENDTRAGNIGYLTREYEPGKFTFSFGFGDAKFLSSLGLEFGTQVAAPTYADLKALRLFLEAEILQVAVAANVLAKAVLQLQDENTVPKLNTTKELRIPVE